MKAIPKFLGRYGDLRVRKSIYTKTCLDLNVRKIWKLLLEWFFPSCTFKNVGVVVEHLGWSAREPTMISEIGYLLLPSHDRKKLMWEQNNPQLTQPSQSFCIGCLGMQPNRTGKFFTHEKYISLSKPAISFGGFFGALELHYKKGPIEISPLSLNSAVLHP